MLNGIPKDERKERTLAGIQHQIEDFFFIIEDHVNSLSEEEMMDLYELEEDMVTCKNCKTWYIDWGGVCDFTRYTQNKGPTKLEVMAKANDDTDLNYRLETGPDFGCIHFKRRTKK